MEKIKTIVLFDIDNTLFNTLKFKESNLQMFSVYEEVYDVLKQLSEVVDLGIFSEGEIAFQENKLKQTNIEKYFLKEHTYIVPKKIEAVEETIKKYKGGGKLFLIDDKLEALQAVKQHYPSIVTIWIKRGQYAPFRKPIPGFTPDAEIEQLQDVIPLIVQS